MPDRVLIARSILTRAGSRIDSSNDAKDVYQSLLLQFFSALARAHARSIDWTFPPSKGNPFNEKQLRPILPIAPEEFSSLYESLLHLTPTFGKTFELHDLPRSARKSTGSYYTPPELIDLLLDHGLDPIIARFKNENRPISDLRLIDPACGTGHFLLAATRRLACAFAAPIAHVLQHCIHGTDVDPVAHLLCKLSLYFAQDKPTMSFSQLNERIQLTDGLFPPAPDKLAKQFDLVLGNPPFINAIEGGVTLRTKSELKSHYPELGGTADLAAYFLARAARLARPDGTIAMVQPRAILNAPAADRLRQELMTQFPPTHIYAPNRANFFPGAAVYISCLVLSGPLFPRERVRVRADETNDAAYTKNVAPSVGPHPSPLPEGEAVRRCLSSTSLDPTKPQWRSTELSNSNWWTPLHAPPKPRPSGRGRATSKLADLFDIHASMTAGDAYDILPHLVDSESGDFPKLITTGLIDPAQNLWGQSICRYLKRDFSHPRINPKSALSNSLKNRLTRSRRPKILVAGLSKNVECFLDLAGECIGAVSTYSIYHPQDDVRALKKLARHLLSKSISHLFHAHLGGNALGGGNTTMKKQFLQNLEFPT